MTIYFGTGHRPEDCKFTFDAMTNLTILYLEQNTEEEDVYISGMAAGFDLAFGLAVLSLKRELWIARPWAGHRARRDDVEIYAALEDYASRKVAVNPARSYPGSWVYHERNRWMVDNADEGIAFWSGKHSGGTFACLEYAEKKDKPVTNIYPFN